MDAYLPKPLRPKDLIDLVESVSRFRSSRPVGAATACAAERESGSFDFQTALESLDNDVDLLAGQMRFFLHDGQALVDQAEQAIERQEPRTLRLAAHRLKGMLARYAYHEAVEVARELERRGDQGAFDGAQSLCRQLAHMVHRLAEAIERDLRDRLESRYAVPETVLLACRVGTTAARERMMRFFTVLRVTARCAARRPQRP